MNTIDNVKTRKEPTSCAGFMALMMGRLQARFNRMAEPKHVARVQETLDQAKDFTDLQSYLEVDDSEYQSISTEFDEIKAALKANLGHHSTSDINLLWLEYLLCRSKKPSKVMEAGVWIGSSSHVILRALQKNGTGHLSSIDFPPLLKKHRVFIGKVVQEDQYPLWSLHLGPSKTFMRKIAKPSSLGIFIHDSDHTYKNMMAEFEIAWDLLEDGGYLVSDDASWNDSVLDFSEKVGVPAKFFHRGGGGSVALMRKPS